MVHSNGIAVAPEDLAEAVYSQLIGGDDDSVIRFRSALDDLMADGQAADGIAASVAAGDGLWVAVPGDGGDAISSGSWRRQLHAAGTTHA